jgi:hypothetical protein
MNMKIAHCLLITWSIHHHSLLVVASSSPFNDRVVPGGRVLPALTKLNKQKEEVRRDLLQEASCDTTTAYHPDYSLPWSQGHCVFTITCNSRSYDTELACCQAEYSRQESGFCLSQLDNPPTQHPTKIGGPDIWYPDYSLNWSDGKCINTVPVPSGRPTYITQLACCKGAYGGQSNSACINALVNPPTPSPTKLGGPDIWYPDYSLDWSDGKCINTVPVPSGRQTYITQLACCKGAYGGQSNSACINALVNPPTPSPTKIGGPDIW